VPTPLVQRVMVTYEGTHSKSPRHALGGNGAVDTMQSDGLIEERQDQTIRRTGTASPLSSRKKGQEGARPSRSS